jgi:drug/metabolite transporter (DMT)-like permease
VSAVLPVIAGLALGNQLSALADAGILVAIPAIALVSWQQDASDGKGGRAGLLEGVFAGVGFSILFIALDRAGTKSGAWPLLPGQAVALLIILPFALRARVSRAAWRSAAALVIAAGLLSGTANLLFLASTAYGQLAVVAVLAALYPAVTVLLARVVLSERWSQLQAVGLVAAAAAIVLVGLG